MDQLIGNINKQKLRGGYYTPQIITEFLCEWSIDNKKQHILEPSCGDGNFIESIIKRLQNLNNETDNVTKRVTGIELIEEEAKKAEKRVEKFNVKDISIINSDYFKFVKTNKNQKYDVIIGNPPFIRYQNFPEEHRKIAIEMMEDLGLKPNKLTNIWVPFLVISASLLTSDGKLAMVIPAELFQVKYAAQTRIFLSEHFERINIITFNKLVFDGIQQEVVLLLCEKKIEKNSEKGIRVFECESLETLKNIDVSALNKLEIKPIDHDTEKWTKYFLTKEEIILMKKIKKDKRIFKCKDYFSTEVGLVTGRNEFFMMTYDQVKRWDLEEFTIPVVSKSNQLKGIIFTNLDFEENSKAQKPIYLFLPPDKDFEELPENCKKYIKYGEEKGFHLGYKTRIRKRWYITPSRWKPDGFALRQVGLYPKIIQNITEATSTDTIHRIKFKEGVDTKLATISFLNSLTLASSEVNGRSYGGGVLTFEPSEIGEINIPKIDELELDFELIDSLIRGREIEKVMDIIDKALLIDLHKFRIDEVNQMRQIWKKLSDRRNNRKK